MLTTNPNCVYPPLGIDEGLCSLLPKDLQVDRIAHSNPLKVVLDLRNKFRQTFRSAVFKRATNVKEGSVERQYSQPSSSNLWAVWKECILQWLFYFPDHQQSWLRPAVRQFSQIPPRERPDVVLATGSPWTNLLVGHELAKVYRVPFIADFRDPWIDNPCLSELPRYLSKKSERLERFICQSADRITTTTPELTSRLASRYPEQEGKIITITNGFDEEIFKKDIAVYSERDRGPQVYTDKNARLEIAHFGTVYGARNPFHLLAASWELFKEKVLGPDNFLLRFVGAWEVPDTRCNELAEELEHIGIVFREPSMDHALCLTAMSLAQVLLVLQHGFPLQVPGKIYEYIATGRPILVIGGEGATTRLVRRNKLGRCCPNSITEIKETLKGHVTGQSPIKAPQLESTVRFSYRSLTNQLCGVLTEITESNLM